MFKKNEQKQLKQLCYLSIEEEFNHLDFKFDPAIKVFDQQCGVFVTLKINGNLRGCIGLIESSQPLYQTLYDIAKKAAFADPRFAPLSKSELAAITIELSVMSIPQKISTIDQIEVGKHGLIIKKDDYSGLLLPQVAVQWGWDRNEFLAQTSRKAGLPKDAWKQAQIWVFSAFVF
tara:strand:- start:344 stop:868 length:525 start_codon:yes stop_codon:yes gene_type:complete